MVLSFPASKHHRWRRPGRASCVGLDIGPNWIRLAALRPQRTYLRQRRHLRLDSLAEQALDAGMGEDGQFGDIERLTHACRQLLQRHAPDAGAVVMAIPANAVRTTLLTLPAGSNAVQRLAQVHAELAAHGVPLEEQTLDFRTLAPVPESPDVAVLALSTPSLLVEDRLALAASLALPLRAMPAGQWCLPHFIRDAADGDSAVLHLGASGNWLSPHTDVCRTLAWQAARPLSELLQELAPLLCQAPPRLLLTGDCAYLETAAAALRKYAGIDAGLAGIPASVCLADSYATALPLAASAPFHCAMALAAEGFE